MRRTSYGKKGGEGPTRGRKKTTYEVPLPDGRVVRVGSFYVDADEAPVAIYEHKGVWHVAGVRVAPCDPSHGYAIVTGRRVG